MTQRSDRPCFCGSALASVVKLGKGREVLRCEVCSLLARVEMPSEEELTQFYREEYWNRYRDEQVASVRNNVYVHTLDWLESFHPHLGTLVDVGCGAGALLTLCRERRWRGIGFDPSIQAVTYARARGLEAYTHSWPPSPLADETADAVTFINVLDHLRDPFGALQEAWRTLRVGGLLYIRVPNGPIHASDTSIFD